MAELNTHAPSRRAARIACSPKAKHAWAPRRPAPTETIVHSDGEASLLRSFHAACLDALSDSNRGSRLLADTADALAVELGRHLARVVGKEGYRALLTRSLRLTAPEFPDLADVHPAAGPTGRLVGLHRLVQHAGADESRAAIATTLTGVVRLLSTFIGEDLTRSLLRETRPWTGVPGNSAASSDHPRGLTA